MTSDRPEADGAFGRLWWRVAAALAICMIALAAVVLTGGPRLRQAEINQALATAQPNQRLILRANQPLAKLDASQISIEPAVDFGVANNANNIVITLKQRLRHDTDYRVTVKDVAPLYDNRLFGGNGKTSFTHTFSTDDPTAYYLKRAGAFNRSDDSPDKIMSTRLLDDVNDNAPVEVFSDRRIQDFVILDDKLIVSTLETDGSNRLVSVDKLTRVATELTLPAEGTADQLLASSDGTTYGFRFTGLDRNRADFQQNVLFMHDTTPGRLMVPLSDIAGKPLQVLEWLFASDGSSVAARTFDMNLLLIDTNFTQTPLALGIFNSIGGFAADGVRLSVRNNEGFAILDIPNRKIAMLDESRLQVDGSQAIPIRTRPLPNGEGVLVQVQTAKDQGRSLVDSLLIVGQNDERVIRSYEATQRLLVDYYLSQNDQYIVAEEAAPAGSGRGSVHDGYPGQAKPLQTRSVLLDADNGDILRRYDGIKLAW